MNIDIDLLVLHRLLYRQPRKLNGLLRQHGSAARVLALEAPLAQSVTQAVRAGASADVAWSNAPGHHLIFRTDADYPSLLAEISDPPPLLFGLGDRSVLSDSDYRAAIVGARKASRYGLSQATRIAGELVAAGVVVVSGLALGIDAAAHEGALIAGGKTIAVLGCGPDRVYPRRNWRIAERIARNGLILSEFPTGTGAMPGHFPQRNRIVAGLCQATLVIEAALASGSLISAKLAAGEGRDVLALPGLVTNPEARGCHQLIRDGALLMESAEDVLAELGLGGPLSRLPNMAGAGLSPEQQALLAMLAQGPMSVDELVSLTDDRLDQLTVNLVTLEVLGLVTASHGCYERTTG